MLESKLLNLALDLVSVAAAVGAALLVEWLRRKLGEQKLRRIAQELAAKQELATLAVRFVEQAYKDLHGPAKLQAASEWLAARAAEHGLKLQPDEIRGLIEAALRAIKDEFGEEWAKVTQTHTVTA